MLKLILLVLSYFLGSVPFGFLITHWVKGIDIRTFGSGNIGATNVTRALGKKWGILVFFLDFLKGFTAPLAFAYLAPEAKSYFVILACLLVVCGHNWTVFLKFKGGKGVATSCGAVCSLSFIFLELRAIIIISLIVWALIFYIFKYVSLASLAASGVFFAACLFYPLPFSVKVFSLALFAFIVMRHRKNIKGLLSKKERRF